MTQEQREIFEAVTKEISESGYIKPEALPELTEKIRKSIVSENYSEIGFSALFLENDLLTLEEKKKYGYPTKQKISRDMINKLSQEGLKLSDPKGELKRIYSYNYSKVSKKYKIIEMKNKLASHGDDFIGYRVIAAIDYSTCIICGAWDGTILKTVSDVEKYEKHKCLKNNCRCIFNFVQKGFEKNTGETYAGWFKKLSVKEKKEILGEYFDRYKAGETLKDIVFSFTEETAKKYRDDLEARIKLRETEEAKKPKVKKIKLLPLTEEQLQEFYKYYSKMTEKMIEMSNAEKQDWVNRAVEQIKSMKLKDQHIIYKDTRKRNLKSN
jgi:hypothetical protein